MANNNSLMYLMQGHLRQVSPEGYQEEEFQRIVRSLSTYQAAIKETITKLEILSDEFRLLHDHNPIHHIENRLKTPASIREKIKRRGLEFTLESITEHITDIAGVRVVCHYIEDIYLLADLLLGQPDIQLIRRSDYIKSPKENGYRSLHLILKVPVMLSVSTEHFPVEIQIRTIAMDMWASLEHEMRYKSQEEMAPELVKELKDCADTIAHVDEKMQNIYHQLNMFTL